MAKQSSGTEKTLVIDRVVEIIAGQLQVDRSEVTLEASFVKDLEADSLDMMEVVMKLEEVFGISIPDKEAQEITTVKEAVDYILEHCPDAV